MAWINLTDREKQLDRAIENSGIKLDNSDRCVRAVVNAIGANKSEISFVKQRIQLRLRTEQLLNSTDSFIDNTEKMLEKFKKDDEEWERKGRALGFKFWD